MELTWEEILKGAKKDTDAVFAAKVSSLIRLTDAEIMELVPDLQDREALAAVMGVVADASKSNAEKAAAIGNINGALQVLVPLVMKLV